jgi:hypothetical protein
VGSSADPARYGARNGVSAATVSLGSLLGEPVSGAGDDRGLHVVREPNQLVAIALPRAPKTSGLVWRLARRYDAGVLRQVSEADVDVNVVVVFKVLSRGKSSLVIALTCGDASSKAVKSATHKILSR